MENTQKEMRNDFNHFTTKYQISVKKDSNTGKDGQNKMYKTYTKQITNYYIPVITLNIKGLLSPIERHRMAE